MKTIAITVDCPETMTLAAFKDVGERLRQLGVVTLGGYRYQATVDVDDMLSSASPAGWAREAAGLPRDGKLPLDAVRMLDACAIEDFVSDLKAELEGMGAWRVICPAVPLTAASTSHLPEEGDHA